MKITVEQYDCIDSHDHSCCTITVFQDTNHLVIGDQVFLLFLIFDNMYQASVVFIQAMGLCASKSLISVENKGTPILLRFQYVE